MKIYINKNCNGYHWFEGEPLGKAGKLEMLQMQAGERSQVLSKMLLYSQYEVIMVENDSSDAIGKEPALRFYLAINNLPEHHRKDTFGRPLNFQLIFESGNPIYVDNLLCAYLSNPEGFAEVFSLMFSAGTINLICDCDKMNAYLQDLFGKRLKKPLGKMLNFGRPPVMFICTKSSEIISEKFGWNKRDIERINYKSLDSFAGMEFFEKGLEGDGEKKALRGKIQELTNENQILAGKVAEPEKEIKHLHSENERLTEEHKKFKDCHMDGFGLDPDTEKALRGKIQELMNENQVLAGKVKDSEREVNRLCSETNRLVAVNEKLKKGCTIALVAAALFLFLYFFK